MEKGGKGKEFNGTSRKGKELNGKGWEGDGIEWKRLGRGWN